MKLEIIWTEKYAQRTVIMYVHLYTPTKCTGNTKKRKCFYDISILHTKKKKKTLFSNYSIAWVNNANVFFM